MSSFQKIIFLKIKYFKDKHAEIHKNILLFKILSFYVAGVELEPKPHDCLVKHVT